MADPVMATYNLKDKNKGKEAQALALQSREAKKQEGRDEVNINDATTESVKAEQRSVGFFGWFKRLFSDKVDFTINGTQITGKKGFQARGGVVPLFSGGVLDLIPAYLKADNDSTSGDQFAHGPGAKLVIAPTNKDYMVEIILEDVTVRKKGDGTELIKGQSAGPVELEYEGNKKVKGDSVNITSNQGIELINPKVITGNSEEMVEDAIVDDDGLQVTMPSSASAGNNDAENSSASTPEYETGTSKKQEVIEWGTSKLIDTINKTSQEEEDSNYQKPEFDFNDYKNSLTELLEKMGIENATISQLLEKNEAEEDSDSEEAFASGEVDVKLAEVMIIPGLNFHVILRPSFSLGYGYHVGFNITRPTAENPNQEYSFSMSVQAGLCGSLGLALVLGLEAGNSYIFGANADIVASADINGDAKIADEYGAFKKENPFFLGGGSIKLTGEDALKNAKTTLSLGVGAGIALEGSIKVEGSLESKLFDWEQELGEYTFASWKLGGMQIQQTWEKTIGDGTPLFSTKGWKTPGVEKTTEALGKEFGNKKDQNYGVQTINEKQEAVDALVASENITIEEFQVLSDKIQGIIGEINKTPSRNITRAEKNAYDILMDKLYALESKNIEKLTDLQLWITLNSEQVGDVVQDDTWNNTIIGCNNKIADHNQRITQLKAWAEEWITSGSEESLDAYVAFRYMDKYSGRGVKKGLKEEINETAEKEVGTKDRILAFEEESMQNDVKKHTDRLALIQTMETAGIDINQNTNVDAIDAYMKETKSKNILNFLGDYSNIHEILSFEKQNYDKEVKSHAERILKMRGEQAKLNLIDTDLKHPHDEFAKFYVKDLGGDRFKSQMFSLNDANGQGAITNFNVASVIKSNWGKDIDGHNERILLLEGTKSDEEKVKAYYQNKKGFFHRGGVEDYQFTKEKLYGFLEKQGNVAKIQDYHYKYLTNESLASYFKIEDIKQFIIGNNTGIPLTVNSKFASDLDVSAYCKDADLLKKISGGKNDALNKLFLSSYQKHSANQLSVLDKFDKDHSKNVFDVWAKYIDNGGVKEYKDILNKDTKDEKKSSTKTEYGAQELLSYEKFRIQELDNDKVYSLYRELIANGGQEVSEEHRAILIKKHEKIADKLFEERAKYVTPQQLFDYENTRMQEKGQDHKELIDYLQECERSETDYPEVIAGYRDKVRGQRTTFEKLKVLFKFTSDNTDFDDELKEKYKKDPEIRALLTLDKIKEYEEKRVSAISDPANARIKFLNESTESSFSSAGELGTMKTQFFNKHSKEIKQKKEAIASEYYSYEKLLEYEQRRSDFYTEKKARATNMVKELTEQQIVLSQLIKNAQEYQTFFDEARKNKQATTSNMESFARISKTIQSSKQEQGPMTKLTEKQETNKKDLITLQQAITEMEKNEL